MLKFQVGAQNLEDLIVYLKGLIICIFAVSSILYLAWLTKLIFIWQNQYYVIKSSDPNITMICCNKNAYSPNINTPEHWHHDNLKKTIMVEVKERFLGLIQFWAGAQKGAEGEKYTITA